MKFHPAFCKGWWVLAVAGFGRPLSACGADFTCVDERSCPLVAEPDGGGSGGAGGSGAGGGVGSDGAPDDGGLDIDPAVDAPSGADSCATEQPNQELGIFVSADGDDGADGSTCGAIGAPCATIKKASALAKAGNVVYLGAGTYEEDGLALVAGVTLEGGWERRVGGAWTRACGPERNAAAVIRARSADRTLSAVDLGGSATIRTLTIRSKRTPAPADQSVYGIFASGAETELVLSDVRVDVSDAGDGSPGTPGQDGEAPGSSCASGSGTNAATAGASGKGAPLGIFTAAGYVPAPGTSGGPGGSGASGTPAPAAPCVACTQSGAACQFPPACTGDDCLFCRFSQSLDQCGAAGLNGCGGGGGKGGTPGSGGGSSIGIFVFDATLLADNTRVAAGRGGDGGPGGPGGQGRAGSLGAPGTSGGLSCQVCFTRFGPPRCEVQAQAAGPGAPGGPGGSGKDGGPGGGGAGGHSYAIYKGGSAVVNVAPSVELVAGAPGSGGGVAPGRGADGSAKAIGP